MPKALGDLGISDEELSRHIGWDIGGLDAAIELAQALDAPLLASGYSRLVIDCNRWPGGEGSTPEVSDGTPVPANRGLTKEQVDARAEACFWPYHRAVDRQLDRMTAGGRQIALLVMHSFTPGDERVSSGPGMSACCGTTIRACPSRCSPNCAAIRRWSSATTSPIRRASRTNTRSPPMPSRAPCRIARWKCART